MVKLNDTDAARKLFEVSLSTGGQITFEISLLMICALVFISGTIYIFYSKKLKKFKEFEIDTAELGVGKNKLRFKPNYVDRQIAYAIWVEMSTRKIGLPIDQENDVVLHIYDSWYSFFGIVRDLLKNVPVSKLDSQGTRQIVKISIDLLNLGLRPHLTRWQARFRHWVGTQEAKQEGKNPQELQKDYGYFEDLFELVPT